MKKIVSILIMVSLLFSTISTYAVDNYKVQGEESPKWLNNMTKEERTLYGKEKIDDMKLELVKIYLEKYGPELKVFGIDIDGIDEAAFQNKNEVHKIFKEFMKYKNYRRKNIDKMNYDIEGVNLNSTIGTGISSTTVYIIPLLAYDDELSDICSNNNITVEEYMISEVEIMDYYYRNYFDIAFDTDNAPIEEWNHAGFTDLSNTSASDAESVARSVSAEFPLTSKYQNETGKEIYVDMVFAFSGPDACNDLNKWPDMDYPRDIMGRIDDRTYKHLWKDTWSNDTRNLLMHEVGHLYEALHCIDIDELGRETGPCAGTNCSCFMIEDTTTFNVCSECSDIIEDNRLIH